LKLQVLPSTSRSIAEVILLFFLTKNQRVTLLDFSKGNDLETS
jgi:hypothetical protein